MKYFTFIICILAFSNLAFSQTKEVEKVETEITVCPIKLAARPLDFRYGYRYIIKTDEKGSLVKISQLGKDKYPHFVNYEDFIPCMEKWKLNPSEDYFVIFDLGTTSPHNYILISSKTEKITIHLGKIVEDLVDMDKK